MSRSRSGFAFTIWTEKQAGGGEDSPPLLEQSDGVTLVGVFDGLGGAGGRRYKLDDQERTGAFLASRTAALAVRGTFEAGLLRPPSSLESTESLVAMLRTSLQTVVGRFEASKSRVRSRMRRELPTTMAVASVQDDASDAGGAGVDVGVWWAGDSRVYALCPDVGLIVLTEDHVVGGGDAMTNLSNDAALENCLSADRDFHIEAANYQLEMPVALLAATDGCFGYVPTPMHFEYMLLSSLAQATDAAGWKRLLRDWITKVAADDAAISMVVLGADFDEFQSSCRTRGERLNREWIVPIENALSERIAAKTELRRLEKQFEDTTESSWAAYDKGYGAHQRSRSTSDEAAGWRGTEEVADEEG